ncbi:MAG: type I secretion C-terminal target domain-containing protein [Verrucomicrobiota bacterium]
MTSPQQQTTEPTGAVLARSGRWPWVRWIGTAALAVVASVAVSDRLGRLKADTITEPDVVLFGKVVNLSGGATRQLFSGSLSVTLVHPTNPQQTVTRTTTLRRVGRTGEYSYRLSIPLQIQPDAVESGTSMVVGAAPVRFGLQSLTLDGTSMQLLNPAQVRRMLIGSGERGQEFQVDLQVARVQKDSDGDGAPDWWEDQNGLNKFSAADAVLDPDQDALSNRQEFLRGTDPRVANTSPLVLETAFQVPVGGTAGLVLDVVAQGSDPTNLMVSVVQEAPGLAWRLAGIPLPRGVEFPYQAMLEGRVDLRVSTDFESGVVQVGLRDATPGKTNEPVRFPLRFEGLSPALGLAVPAALWLDSRTVAPEGWSMTDWTDLSGNDLPRDAYQGLVPAQPLSRNGQVRFEGGRFFHIDDRGLALPQFTSFLAFDADTGGASSQTLFRMSDLQVDVQTTGGVRYLQTRQPGRTTLSPLAGAGGRGVYTLTGGEGITQVELPDAGASLSSNSSAPLQAAFSTLGALLPLVATTPSNPFEGSLREVILFDSVLPPVTRSLLQDYQLSRWEGVTVWNYRNHVLPVGLTGRDGVRNSLRGGHGDDRLVGGSLGDILRGGPGNNVLTGAGGPDRFAFERTGGRDVVTDFNAAQGDVVDLTDLVDVPSGLKRPDVRVRSQVTRGTNNLPRVDTVIEVRPDGPTGAVNQTITLLNVAQLPDQALRLPAVGGVPIPPTFVTVEPAGTAVGDADWMAPVPNVVDGSVAVDRNGVPVAIEQSPAAGRRVGPGDTSILLTARDAAGNTASVTTVFRILGTLSWGAEASGGLRLTVPAGAVLESSTDLTGPWTPMPSAKGVVVVPSDPARKAQYYRLRTE